MLFWLDNKDNHKDAVNENYGREILELFSMGVGNYTEVDVRQCSRAFTGWTIRNATLHTARVARDSVWPYGRLDWQFVYRADDHDDGTKSFLGHTGAFDGDEIIDIICRQPATARFIARHLYNFFVADEPQVPAWPTVPPRDPEAITTLMDALSKSSYDIRVSPACALQLRLLQASDLCQDQKSSGDGGEHRPRHRWTSLPELWRILSWPWRLVPWGNNSSIHRASKAGTRGRNGSTPRPSWPVSILPHASLLTSTSRGSARFLSVSGRRGRRSRRSVW